MADTDISRVISLIMENPKLIEEIKGLADKDGGAQETVTSEPPAEVTKEIEAHTFEQAPRPRRRRQDLLEALKPYISDERRKAVESFVTIAEILDMMREK